MIVDDFNEILGKNEKWCGKKFNLSKEKLTLDFMKKMKMTDLGSIGPTFMWSNTRKGFAHVKERLDKAIGNIEWHMTFLEAIFSVY